MKNNKASRTADYTAAMRARHFVHDTEMIFNDPVANRLTSPGLSFLLQQKAINWVYKSPLVPAIQGSESLILYRADYIEQQLKDALERGCTQYVIIAAGMDSYAYRCEGISDQVTVYEVDHPATQAVKRQRLARHNIQPEVNTEYIGADLASTSLTDALSGSSFQADKITFFSCAGLIYYLSEAHAFALFKAIADLSAPGSQLAFDYSDNLAEMTLRQRTRRKIVRTFLKLTGEVILSSFEEQQLLERMESYNFRLNQDIGPAEIHQRYFEHRRKDGLAASAHNHLACFEKC